jgi:hypothetical protein
MQHPRLYLGLMGFDASAQAAVNLWLKRYLSRLEKTRAGAEDLQPIWQIVDFSEADALLFRGAGVIRGCGSQLEFDPALKVQTSQAPLGADLNAIRLPFAVSDLAHLQGLGVDLKTHPVFELTDSASMQRTLAHFETMLLPLRALFALAKELTQRREELDGQHTFHLERNGSLDAIIDPPRRRVLMRPGTRPVDIHADAWLNRPKSANYAPAHFIECSMDEVAWVYAMHCDEPDLPKRYLTQSIYVRHNPRVRTSLLYPRHAALMDLLWQQPTNLAQLRKKLPGMAHLLERDLFGLYLTRSISTAVQNHLGQDGAPTPGAFDTTGKWILQSVSRRMNTMAGELQSLF